MRLLYWLYRFRGNYSMKYNDDTKFKPFTRHVSLALAFTFMVWLQSLKVQVFYLKRNHLVNVQFYFKQCKIIMNHIQGKCKQLNMIIKTNSPSIFWNYFTLICEAEILYLPPFYLNHKFLVYIFLDQSYLHIFCTAQFAMWFFFFKILHIIFEQWKE